MTGRRPWKYDLDITHIFHQSPTLHNICVATHCSQQMYSINIRTKHLVPALSDLEQRNFIPCPRRQPQLPFTFTKDPRLEKKGFHTLKSQHLLIHQETAFHLFKQSIMRLQTPHPRHLLSEPHTIYGTYRLYATNTRRSHPAHQY